MTLEPNIGARRARPSSWLFTVPLTAAVLVAGCGLRVPESERRALAAAAPAPGLAASDTRLGAGAAESGPDQAAAEAAPGATGPGAVGPVGATGATVSAAATAPRPSSAKAAAGTAAPSPRPGLSSPQGGPVSAPAPGGSRAEPAPGAAATGGGCQPGGGATAPGVTADSVLIGAILALSGPTAPTLSPYRPGYEAGIAEINAGGGVCGRKVKLIIGDSGGNATRYGEIARDFIDNKKVFALTAGELAHQGGAQFIAERRVPVIGGESASNVWYQNPMYFPIGNQYNGTAMMGSWAAKNKRLTKAAVMSLSLAVSQEGCETTKFQLKKSGVPIVYEASVPIGTPDMSSYVQQARSAGADGILQCFDIGTGVALMKAIQQQQWKVYVGAVSGSADELLLTSASPEVLEGMEVNFPVPAWTDTANPAIQRFNRAYRAVAGANARGSSWAVRGYAGAMLLKSALEGAGAAPTRDGVITFLNRQNKFTLDGLLPPDTTFVPDQSGNHRESNCSQEWVVRKGQFTSASNGWVCLDTQG